MFGRTTIRLGIGPHSSLFCCAVIAACSNKCEKMQYEVTPCVGAMERKCDGEATFQLTVTL